MFSSFFQNPNPEDLDKLINLQSHKGFKIIDKTEEERQAFENHKSNSSEKDLLNFCYFISANINTWINRASKENPQEENAFFFHVSLLLYNLGVCYLLNDREVIDLIQNKNPKLIERIVYNNKHIPDFSGERFNDILENLEGKNGFTF